MASDDEKKLKELEKLRQALKSKDDGAKDLEKLVKEAKSLVKELENEE